MGNENTKNNNKILIILIILIAVTIVAVGVTVAVILNGNKKVSTIPPDYAPVETDDGMETIEGDDDEKLPVPEGGGSASITWGGSVKVDLSDKSVSLDYQNPGKSNEDALVQVVIINNPDDPDDDLVIAQSGRVTPGHRVTSLEVINETEKQLAAGGYNGMLVIHHYDPVTGEKAMVETNLTVTITVAE